MDSSLSGANDAADDSVHAMHAVLAAEASGDMCRPHQGQNTALLLPAVPHNSGSQHLCSHLLHIRVAQHSGIDARQAPSSLFA